MRPPALLILVLALHSTLGCLAHDDQRYDFQEKVVLFLDNMMPEDNPSETYQYLDLGFCEPLERKYKSQTFAEIMGGSRNVYSSYDLRFAVDVPQSELCSRVLKVAEIKAFIHAIKRSYHFTMNFDDIPLRGYVGHVNKEGEVFLHNTLHFKLTFNRDRVIDAHVATHSKDAVKLPADPNEPLTVLFSYTVKWYETDVTFEDRSTNASDLFPEAINIQWINIVNSGVVALIAVGSLMFLVLRVLKKDLHEYTLGEDADELEAAGWKRLHGDVFRFPQYKSLFCAILGCGTQIMIIFIGMLTLAVLGVFGHHGRGTTFVAIIVLYALTAFVAGFVSGGVLKSMGGTQWINNVLLVVTLFAGPLFLIWLFLNMVAVVYSSTAALPFGTIAGVIALYLFVTFPLTLAGGIAGRKSASEFYAPTRTKFAPREIPPCPWYSSAYFHVFIAGLIPFIASYVEFFYVFQSIWGHYTITPFGILYLVFLILLVVSGCVTVALCYFQLRVENHLWWWRSIVSGGAASFFILVYSSYFLNTHSQMNGFLQLSYYAGYTLLFCYAIFLMLGTIGFFFCLIFVREIFKTIKSD